MQKRLFEIFDEVTKAPDDKSRVAILFHNQTVALTNALRAVYHPGVQFLVTELPNYRKNDVPTGFGSVMDKEIHSLYLFEKYNPRRPVNLTQKRMTQILIQILEGLESREAEVYGNILKKDLQVPGLTKEVVLKAFPRLLD